MPKPMENKSPAIRQFIDDVFPGTKAAIDAGHCPLCRRAITEFRNAKSIKEYGISGMCQGCQDEVFGRD